MILELEFLIILKFYHDGLLNKTNTLFHSCYSGIIWTAFVLHINF